MKHAILLQLLARLTAEGSPSLTVLDTHAGAGTYDLESEAARRSGEADRGVRRLMAADRTPSALRPLADAVRAANLPGRLQAYPGSPSLIVQALRAGDRYIGCDLGKDAQVRLAHSVEPIARAHGVGSTIVRGDGYAEVGPALQAHRRALVFIDPPFERADDYARIVQTAAILSETPEAVAAIWTPLKDLETFDALLRALEKLGSLDISVAEVRLRPPNDPMRMNGCAMVLLAAPNIESQAQSICDWVATAAGESGGSGRVFRL